MPIILYRVDDRLIHGQVVIGWGNQLRPSRYVVVDDEIASSEWEQELYRLGLPPRADAAFFTVDEARAHLPEWQSDAARAVLLLKDPGSARRLARDGLLSGAELNLGGLHHRAGRAQVLSYVYLDDQDREDLAAIADEGVRVVAKDLPGSATVALTDLLGR